MPGGLVDQRGHLHQGVCTCRFVTGGTHLGGYEYDVGCACTGHSPQRTDLQTSNGSKQRVIVLDVAVLDRQGASGVVYYQRLVV